MNITTATFALTLSLLAPEERLEYVDVVTELEVAIENYAQEDRPAAIMKLEGMLEQVTRFPGHSPDTNRVPEVLLRARVVLVRLYLAEDDPESAAMIMDEAIRMARGQELPVRAYGPKVFRLFQERSKAISSAGKGTIAVSCEREPGCDVVINERQLPSGETREELPLGYYRVWVKQADEEGPWQTYGVDLSMAQVTETIEFEAPEGERASSEDGEGPAPSGSSSGMSGSLGAAAADTRPEKKRMLPRVAELTGLGLGLGFVIAGAVLLSFDGQCDQSGERPTPETTPEACGNIYETSPAGGAMMGVGSGLLVVSGFMLAVDEVRVGKAKGRQVMLGVRLRF